MKPPKMYYGIGWNGGYEDAFENEGILVSAGVAWYGKPNDPWFQYLRLPEGTDSLFIDSGGFQATDRWGLSYPYTIGMYFNYAEQLGADYVAGPDFACEPDLHWTRTEQRVLQTVALHIEATDLYERGEWSFEFLPVLQGWEPEHYRMCAELFKEHGIDRDYMCIGTVCKRRNVGKIAQVLDVCEDEFPDAKWHMFGLTRRAWRDRRFWGRFESADTAAWCFNKSKLDEKIQAAKDYIDEIKDIQDGMENQTGIGDFGGE